MQPLTAAPRESLSAEQVLFLLRDAPAVTFGRGLEVLDLYLDVIEDISGEFLSGQATRNNQATIHGTCDLIVGRDIDYGQQLLRPYMTLTAGGVTARFNAGAYVCSAPQADYGESVPSGRSPGKIGSRN